jgi:uncharacterized protein (UPF0335 family)
MTKTETGFKVDNENIKMGVECKPYMDYAMHTAKVIEKLSVAFGNERVNLLDILADGSQIIVWPESDGETGNTLHPDEKGVSHISIQGEIDNPKMFAVLLHEIGHNIDDNKVRALGMSGFLKEIEEGKENADIAEEIRRERAATGFALKVMRPFLKDKTQRKDMVNFLKTYLQGYYDSAVVKMERKKEHRDPNYLHDFVTNSPYGF